METKFFFSKNLRLIVTKANNPIDGKPFIITKLDGTPFKDAGLLIKSFRSLDDFWAHCIDKQEMDERKARCEFHRTPEYIAMKNNKEKERKESERIVATNQFEALKARQYPIPAPYENIGIVLRWLNTQNWDEWNLPELTISYSANQYDCDGKSASTLILDTPIMVDDKPIRKFEFGAPHGYLIHYLRCR